MSNVYRYTPYFLYEFSFISIFLLLSYFFINTHEYEKKKLHMSTLNRKKFMCFNLVPGSVDYDKFLLRYESFCRYIRFL